MKKTLIIALLATLILGAFTACDGDVNALLSGGAQKRVITLEIPAAFVEEYGGMTFEKSGTTSLEVDIPSDCDTWEKLLNVTDIKILFDFIYDSTDDLLVLSLMVYDGKVYFCLYDSPAFGLKLDETKVTYPESILSTTEIKIGGTYTLTVVGG